MRKHLETQFFSKQIAQFRTLKTLVKRKNEIRINFSHSKAFHLMNMQASSQSHEQISTSIERIAASHTQQMQSRTLRPRSQQFQQNWLTLNGQRTKLYEVIQRQGSKLASLELHKTNPYKRNIQMSRSFRRQNTNKNHTCELAFAIRSKNKGGEDISNAKNIKLNMYSIQSRSLINKSKEKKSLSKNDKYLKYSKNVLYFSDPKDEVYLHNKGMNQFSNNTSKFSNPQVIQKDQNNISKYQHPFVKNSRPPYTTQRKKLSYDRNINSGNKSKITMSADKNIKRIEQCCHPWAVVQIGQQRLEQIPL